MSLRRGLALVVVLSAGVSAQSPQPASADRIARDLQNKYDRVTDFSTDFVHSYRGGVLKQQATERGHLLVKKPGKMRWDYTSPEEKVFVSDGVKMYSYIPQDKQVMVATVPPNDATTPALFLAGNGNLTRDFTASIGEVPASMPADTSSRCTAPVAVTSVAARVGPSSAPALPPAAM